MRSTVWVVASLSLSIAGCGDGGTVEPDAEPAPRCEPPPAALPMEGELADPLALPLPGDCVIGGLVDIPGRWFVVDPTSSFNFDYPRFEGTCEDGFKRSYYRELDHDITDDGFTFHAWSDGTRLYHRQSFRFEVQDEPPFEFTSAFVACMLPDGTVAALEANYDNDRGMRMAEMTGTRFGLKDGPATGLTLIGELGTFGEDEPLIGYNVVVEGTHAYVVGPNGFHVIDVSDPAAPAHVGLVPGRYNDVKVVRGTDSVVAYVSPIQDEMTAFIDVTDPAAPVLAGQLPEYSHSVQVQTRGATTHLYLATYTEAVPQYDVTNPLVPTRVGAATVPGEVAGVHDLFVDGDRIYANNTTAGFVAFDVSAGLGNAVELGRTAAPYSHASWVGTAGGRPIAMHGDEGMTRSSDGGAFLRVLDGDPNAETFMTDIGKYQTRPEVGIHNFQLVGDKVYIAYYQDGVRVVDLSDPTQPTEVAHYNTWDPETTFGAAFEGAVGIRVAGGLIYVADSERGLLILQEE